MDQWIATFGSEDLPNDNDDEEEDEQLDTLLSTSWSWCDGSILGFPITTATDDQNIDDAITLDYSSSSAESSSETEECMPQACDLQCVCVDCLKCPNHCTCNYTSHDYECRDSRASIIDRRQISSNKQARDEMICPYGTLSFDSQDGRWADHEFP